MTACQNAALNERDQSLLSRSYALTPPDIFSPRFCRRIHTPLLHGTVKELEESIDETVAKVEIDVGNVETDNSYNASVVFAVVLDVFWLFTFGVTVPIGPGLSNSRGF
jgi:hypothetical protein